MIPIVGTMIGFYILVKCCEVMGKAESQFSSRGAKTTVGTVALLCVVATSLLIFLLWIKGL